jgi:hypothetical protein
MKGLFAALSVSLAVLAGCSSLTLKPGDFAWPVESALKVDAAGMVQDSRYSFSVNVKGLLFEETKDSVNVAGVVVRVIRNADGYFFMTGKKFKNVYVFAQAEGSLKLAHTILITENGLADPAFNQRTPYVQLLNEQHTPVLLTKDGIVEGDKK